MRLFKKKKIASDFHNFKVGDRVKTKAGIGPVMVVSNTYCEGTIDAFYWNGLRFEVSRFDHDQIEHELNSQPYDRPNQ